MDCGFAACHGLMGGKRVLFRCPHCRTKSQVRTSRDLNVLMRELIYACLNHECGHTFAAYLEVARTLSPSAMPDPSVYLPMSEHVRKKIADHPTMTDEWHEPCVTELPSKAVGKPVAPPTRRRAPRVPERPSATDPIIAAMHPGLRPGSASHG